MRTLQTAALVAALLASGCQGCDNREQENRAPETPPQPNKGQIYPERSTLLPEEVPELEERQLALEISASKRAGAKPPRFLTPEPFRPGIPSTGTGGQIVVRHCTDIRIDDPLPATAEIAAWSKATCRDGDYCCGDEGRERERQIHLARVKSGQEKSWIPFRGCYGGAPPSCRANLIGPYTTLSSCTPYELGRVKVDDWTMQGNVVMIRLSSDCPPNVVTVQDSLTLPSSVSTWRTKGGKQGSITYTLSNSPSMLYVMWNSEEKTHYYGGWVAGPGETMTGLPLDKAWEDRGAMRGPYKDFRN